MYQKYVFCDINQREWPWCR